MYQTHHNLIILFPVNLPIEHFINNKKSYFEIWFKYLSNLDFTREYFSKILINFVSDLFIANIISKLVKWKAEWDKRFNSQNP